MEVDVVLWQRPCVLSLDQFIELRNFQLRSLVSEFVSTSNGFWLQRVVGDAEGSLRDLLLHLSLQQKLVDLVMAFREVCRVGKFKALADAFTESWLWWSCAWRVEIEGQSSLLKSERNEKFLEFRDWLITRNDSLFDKSDEVARTFRSVSSQARLFAALIADNDSIDFAILRSYFLLL